MNASPKQGEGYTGPWLLADEPLSQFVYQLNRRGYNRFCLSVNCGERDDGTRLTQQEAHDIARLIAAAPELLASLERCLRYGDLLPELTQEARAAIARATGGQP